MAFLFKHLSLSGKVVGLMREEHLEIPAEALREALTNALCHRQYERYNLFPSIAIYDDRVEIDNPGCLPRELTVESLKLPHKSFPYNLLMAKVLFMSTFLESWGSGIRRMIDLCTAQGVSEPEFVQDGSFMMIRFWRSEHENEHENEHEKLSEREQKILDYISQNPQASIPKMAASLGMSVSTLRRTLQKMAHLVRHEGPDKGGRWGIAHE